MNTSKFSLLANDFIHLRTKLVSTEITNDKNIHDILRIPHEDIKKETLMEILSNYNKENDNTPQRMLFMTDILEALWNIFDNCTLEDDIEGAQEMSLHVFRAFVQTVHPLITNKREFGYATEYLDSYIETRFNCKAVFNKFINAFTTLIHSKEDDELIKYALMSMKISFKFIIKAFNIKLLQNSDGSEQDRAKFSRLIHEVGKFQTEKIRMTNIFSKGGQQR